jgi:ribonuclease HII
MPISALEKRLKKRGGKIIVGLDEVGRGALSASVTAAAVSVQKFSIFNHQFLKKLKDSKKLSSQKREKIFKMLGNLSEVEWGIGRVSEKIIDKINILQATKLAMKRAVNNLISKNKKKNAKVDFLLIDGNFSIDSNIPQKSIVKGDEKIFLIKLASIIAKVSRDKSMLRYHKQYPQYRFDKHKGYGTKLHFKMLKKYGPCKIHRKSFNPIKNYCKI